MAKKKTQAIIAQPGTPADGYTLDVKYDPENDDSFEAKAIFNDGTVRELGSGGSGGSANVYYITYDANDEKYLFLNSDLTPAEPTYLGGAYSFKTEILPEDYSEWNSVLSELVKTEFYLLKGSGSTYAQKLTYNVGIIGVGDDTGASIGTLYAFDNVTNAGELQYFRLEFNNSGNIVQYAHD